MRLGVGFFRQKHARGPLPRLAYHAYEGAKAIATGCRFKQICKASRSVRAYSLLLKTLKQEMKHENEQVSWWQEGHFSN